MSTLRHCFLLLLANIYLINAQPDLIALDDNEGHLTGWIVDGPACEPSPDCLFLQNPDDPDNSKLVHGPFTSTTTFRHGFECKGEEGDDGPSLVMVTYKVTYPCDMHNIHGSGNDNYIKVYTQSGGSNNAMTTLFTEGTACTNTGYRDNHRDHGREISSLVQTQGGEDEIYFEIDIGFHDDIDIEITIEDVILQCIGGNIQAIENGAIDLLSAKSIGTGNELFGVEIPTNGYIPNFKWFGTIALGSAVIINLMICSIYWCCTKERYSIESAKKVMTTF